MVWGKYAGRIGRSGQTKDVIYNYVRNRSLYRRKKCLADFD